ncbi:MAG TPA: glutamate--tRNA ligase [Firmicutes bacterium]|nr:glutamate--tRNA ligase [Bacillota bacterium]
MNGKVRCRFAPSPTGYLHVGGARTALFNWLFARHFGGSFILRIEDTDVQRSTEESADTIIEAMRWLGLEWDEGPGVGGDYGPYFQSQRLEYYADCARRLVDMGMAYPCYCTPEELAERRKERLSRGESPGYDGRCRELTARERAQMEAEGRKPALRFAVPPGETIVHDLIRGDVRFDNSSFDDFVIMKSDGFPMYNLACVIDDSLMKMTHIIRAEEHLPNTPKQIMLYKALGYPLPEFAHVSMILGPDRTKLSKRHGAMSVMQYKEMGYLPEAMVNYLALLGWAYDAEQQIFSVDELIQKFSLDGVSKNPAIFDMKKLEWVNSQHIHLADRNRLGDLMLPFLAEAGLVGDIPSREDISLVRDVVEVARERLKTLKDIVQVADFFFWDEVKFDEGAVKKFFTRPGVEEILKNVEESLARCEPFTREEIEKTLRALAETLGMKAAEVIHPTRVALTGRAASPGLFEVIAILGKEKTLKRLARARDKVREVRQGEIE